METKGARLLDVPEREEESKLASARFSGETSGGK